MEKNRVTGDVRSIGTNRMMSTTAFGLEKNQSVAWSTERNLPGKVFGLQLSVCQDTYPRVQVKSSLGTGSPSTRSLSWPRCI